MLMKDPKKREQMSKEIESFIRKEFNWDTSVKKVSELIKNA